MAEERAFVYVACGAAIHARTLLRSLEYLRPRTRYPIVVVTDSRRNEVAVEHETIVDVATPPDFDHHQASIYLKTSLHRLLPREREHVYLDTDVIARDGDVDRIFDHGHGLVAFARDLTHLESRVGTFSPWAVRCGCPETEGRSCSHLTAAIQSKFGVRVPDDWMHWNGGVFRFGRDAAPFMDTWHRLTMEIFQDPYWKTRDQGTLIATAWMLGLPDQACLPPHFDFIVDNNNPNLCFDRKTGYSQHESIPGIHPSLLHLYHANLDHPGWDLVRDVEDVLEERTRARAQGAEADRRWHTMATVGKRLARRVPRGSPNAVPETIASLAPLSLEGGVEPRVDYEVIVGLPRLSIGGSSLLALTLVRRLLARGGRAHLLLTGRDADWVDPGDPTVPGEPGVPVINLEVAPDASWGGRWGALQRHLEERAPCIYVPLEDWRHSNVSPRLSHRVGIVGIVPHGHPLHLDHVERLARYWNAIICPSAAVAALIAERHPELAGRIVRIPPGVDVPADGFSGEPPPEGPLRIVYHGRLIHERKRVLDLPRIVHALIAAKVPVELTVIGDGPDREQLLARAAHLLPPGAMRWLGALSHERTIEELKGQHACLLISDFEGMPRAVVEAMACGCVPVVSATSGGICELVADGVNGCLVPVGDIEGFRDRLESLYRDPVRRVAMARAARQTVLDRYGINPMTDAFVALLDRIARETTDGVYRRPKGLLRRPPYQVADREVFPSDYFRGVEGVGVFPSYREDYDDYRTAVGEGVARDLPEWRPEIVKPYPVILGATSAPDPWADPMISALARGLLRVDQPGHVLVMSGARLAEKTMRFGHGVPVRNAPPGWTLRRPSWRAMVKQLNGLAPCLYLPGDDWFHRCVSQRLSDGVGVIARIDRLDPLSLRRVSQLAPYWNAVVAGSPAIAERLVELHPALSPRIATIPLPLQFPDRLDTRELFWETPLRVITALEPVATLAAALAAADVSVELNSEEDPDPKNFESCDVFVVTAATERHRVAVLNAMGRGCVPVLGRGDGTICDLVRDGENGYLLADDDIRGFVSRLNALQKNAALCRALAARAFQTANCGAYRDADVFTSYLILFERVLRDIEFGTYRRPVARRPFFNRVSPEIEFA